MFDSDTFAEVPEIKWNRAYRFSFDFLRKYPNCKFIIDKKRSGSYGIVGFKKGDPDKNELLIDKICDELINFVKSPEGKIFLRKYIVGLEGFDGQSQSGK